MQLGNDRLSFEQKGDPWHHYTIVRKFWVWQSSGSSSSKQAELNYGHAWATVPTLIVEENLYLKNQIWS